MGIRLDLVFSFIIMGILTLLIFGVNKFVLENSTDTRLYNDMQMFADVSTDVFQEELKLAVNILQPTDPTSPTNVLRFTEYGGDIVQIERVGSTVQVIRNSSGVPADTSVYDLYLSGIEFDLEPDTVAVPYYLTVTFQTESNPNQHVSFQNEIQTANAFSERRYYLRNVHLFAETGGAGGGGAGGGNEGNGNGNGNNGNGNGNNGNGNGNN